MQNSNNKFLISDISNKLLGEVVQSAENTMKKYKELVKRVGNKNLFKTFRLKERNSYVFTDDKGNSNIRIDLTKIKSS